MWLMTPIGFFSIVQKSADVGRGTLTVRARVRSDLEALRQHGLPGLGEIEESTHSDYRYRAVAPRAEIATAMAAMIDGIDYNNFKSEVASRQGAERAGAYQKVWEILYRLQAPPPGAAAGLARPEPVPLTRKAYHPRNNDQGRPVLLARPGVPTSPATWNDPTQLARVLPKGWMPAQVNGRAVSSWVAAPRDDAGWTALAQTQAVPEPPWSPAPDTQPSAGVVILEADGRIWLSAPSNGMGGRHTVFPQAALSSGLGAQAAALQAAYRSAGLQVRLLRHLIDVAGTQRPLRLYLAERLGGHPADMDWVAQAVLLVPMISLAEVLDDPVDRPAVEALLGGA